MSSKKSRPQRPDQRSFLNSLLTRITSFQNQQQDRIDEAIESVEDELRKAADTTGFVKAIAVVNDNAINQAVRQHFKDQGFSVKRLPGQEHGHLQITFHKHHIIDKLNELED